MGVEGWSHNAGKSEVGSVNMHAWANQQCLTLICIVF